MLDAGFFHNGSFDNTQYANNQTVAGKSFGIIVNHEFDFQKKVLVSGH